MVLPVAGLASVLAGTLSQTAPPGLAASLAASAPAAAASLPHGLLLWHTLDTLMHTKSYLTLAAAFVAAALTARMVVEEFVVENSDGDLAEMAEELSGALANP